MCTIKIAELLKDQSYPQAGGVLYLQIVDKIKCGDKVILDMSGVDTLPSMFLNTSIGRYIDDFGFDILREKMTFHNIGVSQAQRIKDYIQKIVLSKQ